MIPMIKRHPRENIIVCTGRLGVNPDERISEGLSSLLIHYPLELPCLQILFSILIAFLVHKTSNLCSNIAYYNIIRCAFLARYALLAWDTLPARDTLSARDTLPARDTILAWSEYMPA